MEQFLRRTGLFLASALFALLLLSTAGAAVTRFVFSDPNKIKSLIDNSGAYSHILSAILDESQQSNQKEQNDSVSLSDPAIRSAATKAITPPVIKTNVEAFIDGTYHWLDGTVSKPDFKLDLTQPKQAFIEGVGQYAESKAASLPACSIAELRAMNTADFDPLTATCLPRGVTPAQAGAKIRDEAAKQDFLKDPIITADTLTQNPDNGAAGKKLDFSPDVPRGFQASKNAFFALAILAALCAVGIVFLHPNRRAGLRRAAINLAVIGLLVLLLFGVIELILNRIGNSTSLDTVLSKQVIFPIVNEVGHSVGKIYLLFGLIYVALAVTLWLVRHYLVKDTPPQTTAIRK